MRYSPGALRFVLGVAALGLLLGLRLPFMAPSVDDLDSTNFLEGVLDYSPPAHRPHPPGFPVFIAAAKGLNALTGSPLLALTLISAIAGTFAAVPLFVFAHRLFGRDVAVVASAIVSFTPIVWFAGVRPMSDAAGLAAGLTALALLLSGLDRHRPHADIYWMAGVVVAGLAIGVRLQLAVLVLPLFFFGWVMRRRGLFLGPILLAASVLAWWVPMLEHSGGGAPYSTAFRRTMMQAASWEPLLSQPSLARAIDGLRHVAVMPWVTATLAAPVLALAAIGFVRATRLWPGALGLLFVAFAPYAAFNYLIQNTDAIRYALPAVPMVAVLAGVGVTWVASGRRWLVGAAVVVYVGATSSVMMPVLRAYGSRPSPAIRAMEAIPRSNDRPVVSGSGVFYRYLAFAPSDVEVISARDGEGWRRVTQYWRSGGDQPVYFLTVPSESIRTLMAPEAYADAGRFDWPSRVLPFMNGERPNDVRMARLDAPLWFTIRERTEPGTRRADLGLFVRADEKGYDVLLQGRSVDDVPRSVALDVDDRLHDGQALDDGFALQASVLGEGLYKELVVKADGPIEITRVLVVRPSDTVFLPLQGIRRAEGDMGGFHWLDSEARFIAHAPLNGAVLRFVGELPPGRPRPTAFSVSSNDAEFVELPDWSDESFSLSVRLPPAAQAWRIVRLRMTGLSSHEASALRLTDIVFDDLPSDEPVPSASRASSRRVAGDRPE